MTAPTRQPAWPGGPAPESEVLLSTDAETPPTAMRCAGGRTDTEDARRLAARSGITARCPGTTTTESERAASRV